MQIKSIVKKLIEKLKKILLNELLSKNKDLLDSSTMSNDNEKCKENSKQIYYKIITFKRYYQNKKI